jgi:DNA-binding beta-propeller fold protein YncE
VRITSLCLDFGEDRKRAHIADFGRHAVAVLDTITDTAMTTVEVGGNPEVIALSNDGQRLYVADYWAGPHTAISIESVTRDWDNTRHVED